MGQVARWWDTHQSRLQMWMTTSTYFVKIFGGKKITNQTQIPVFTQGQDPEKHISTCEIEWKRLVYNMNDYGRTYSRQNQMNYQTKWYKMEEERGETFLWNELK